MSSQSYQDLAGRIAEVVSLTQTDPARRGDLSQPRLSGALNRGSIVLLSAHLEGYLEDVVVESLDALVQNVALVENVPRLLRAVHAEYHIGPMEPMKDRKARAVRIERLFADESSWWVSGTLVQATMIRQDMVCSEMSNPGSKEIHQFLELIGVDLEGHLRSSGNMSLLGQLNGLVQRRNAIAHGEVSAQATFSDVDGFVQLVDDLCLEIDQAVGKAVMGICASATLPW